MTESSRDRHRSCSDAELSESYGSEEAELPIIRFGRASGGQRSGNGRKKFQFDLEDDFPSPSSLKVPPSGADLVKLSRSGPVVSQSRPNGITQRFAAADQTTSITAGSSLENGAAGALAGWDVDRKESTGNAKWPKGRCARPVTRRLARESPP